MCLRAIKQLTREDFTQNIQLINNEEVIDGLHSTTPDMDWGQKPISVAAKIRKSQADTLWLLVGLRTSSEVFFPPNKIKSRSMTSTEGCTGLLESTCWATLLTSLDYQQTFRKKKGRDHDLYKPTVTGYLWDNWGNLDINWTLIISRISEIRWT